MTTIWIVYLIVSMSVMVYQLFCSDRATDNIQKLHDRIMELRQERLELVSEKWRLSTTNHILELKLNAKPTLRRRLRYLFTGKLQ